jgi:FkbM family methyltransferase
MKIPDHCDILKIDVGLSYYARYSQIWLRNQPNLFVVAFEPSAECRANHNRQLSNLDRCVIEPLALGKPETNTERVTLYRPNLDMSCSSLLKPKMEMLKGLRNTEPITLTSLDYYMTHHPELLERFKIIHHLKIDAQGMDLEVVKGGVETIKKYVVYLTCEPDGYQYEWDGKEENKSVIENIDPYMKSIGFKKVDHPECLDPTYINTKFEDMKDIWINQK